MMKITSLTNPKIKRVVKLKQRKARDESGLTVVDGLREVKRAQEAGVVFEALYVCFELLKKFSGQETADAVCAVAGEVFEVAESVFDKICFGERKEGVVAVVKRPAVGLQGGQWDSKSQHPLVVVLDRVEKPGNLGAILRSCDGAGVDAVIVADTTTDIFSPNVIRASTGVVFSMKVMQGAPDEVRDFLRKQGLRILAAAPDAKQAYFSIDLTGPVAFVLGAEDMGLGDFWLKEADGRIAIPMQGNADSLNVSATAAVLVYEALRQRK